MMLTTMLMTFCAFLMTIQLASCGNHGESDFKTDKKRFKLGDENVPLLKKVVLSDQSVKVSVRDCTVSCYQDHPMTAGQCPCSCSCGYCQHWNFEHNRRYVCCSCPPPPPPPPPFSSACFPSLAKVNVENGTSKAMSEIQVGDRVQTVSSSGNLMFSEVRTFLKRQHDLATTYKSIKTYQDTIFMTKDHLIYARKDSDNSFLQIYADQVSVGDEVLVTEKDELTPTKVINISDFTMQGAFTPLTMEGNIIVDGILASCYASVHHDLAHIGMTPIRWFPRMVDLIFGEDDGFSIFAITAENMAQWIMDVVVAPGNPMKDSIIILN